MTVFVDTGYFVALMTPRDQYHARAVTLSAEAAVLVTSSQVISETATLLQLRGHFSLALQFLQSVIHDDTLRIIFPDEELQRAAWDEYRRSGGFGAGAVDCLSFAIMRRERIRKAWSFDRHFATAGFGNLS